MFRSIVFYILLFGTVIPSLILFVSPVSAVTCSVTIKSSSFPDNTLPGDYNGTIEVIPSQPDCFLSSQEFIVAVYPKYNKEGKTIGASIPTGSIPSFSTFRSSGRGVDCNTDYCSKLEGEINLLFNPRISGTNATNYDPGFHDNQQWVVKVCTDTLTDRGGGRFSNAGLTTCYTPGNIIATGEFFASPLTTTPSPTGPKDLPEIDLSSLKVCTYRSGEKDIDVKVKNILNESGKTYYWWLDGKRDYHDFLTTTGSETEASFKIPKTETANIIGKQRLCVDYVAGLFGKLDSRSHTVANCVNLTFQKDIISPEQDISCNPVSRGSSTECTSDLTEICKKKNTICSLGKCVMPITAKGDPCGNDSKNPGIKTAIGCVHTNPLGFVSDLLGFVVAISGGLAFLLMLLGTFQMITSAGNPETLQAGRERMQSAIIGLLFVIFAVLLLQIIGADILKLPDFNR